MGFVLLLLIGLALYFLPAIIAAERKHRQSGAIFALNLLLGWTLLGWIVAFVWACTSESKPTIVLPVNPAPVASAPPSKKCPLCAEDVRQEAKICRFCGYNFDLQQRIAAIAPNPSPSDLAQ